MDWEALTIKTWHRVWCDNCRAVRPLVIGGAPEKFNGSASPDRVTCSPRGRKPMQPGHVLTQREAEAAVRAILGGG